ncbi:sugar diacid recognition domain-containing protein [Streptococcus merionis]|uniref:CdaR family transcriptional regulator n=1 Tax=Streptococcus merionis TaxID=400065 RepID=UPI0026EC86A2|nr:sugar diacid recognition domain-containing protein [Streptococcus merionis]
MLNKQVAQDIVTRLKDVIHQEINYFSTDATIIASTDPDRIGQKNHEGAAQVLATKEMVIIEYDGQYQGAKQGINLPVIIDQQIVGVIGITGNKSEVLHYGEIIKEMTEILILNHLTHELIYSRRNQNQNVISYIQEEDDDPQQLPLEIVYGVKLEQPRTAAIGIPAPSNDLSSSLDFSVLYTEIEMLFDNSNQQIFEIRGNLIILLLQTTSDVALHQLLQNIIKIVKRKLNIDLIFGVGEKKQGKKGLKRSLSQAKHAVHWNSLFRQIPILSYQKMAYGLVLNDIPHEAGTFFLDHVFKNLTQSQIEDIIQLLQTYESCNGSIKQCGEALFIHKNTVQYQLNKIQEKTGYDPRKLSDFPLLKLASILYQIQKSEQLFDS